MPLKFVFEFDLNEVHPSRMYFVTVLWICIIYQNKNERVI